MPLSALAQLDARAAGQMGLITVGYYTTTVTLSTIVSSLLIPEHVNLQTAIVLVLTIHPGNPEIKAANSAEVHEHTVVSPLDTFLDVIRNMFPENVIQATYQRVQTEYYTIKPKRVDGTSTNHTITKKRIGYVEGMNILGKVLSNKKRKNFHRSHRLLHRL
jgi:solute carrier family 1 (high affinity glutamate transporter) protein 2